MSVVVVMLGWWSLASPPPPPSPSTVNDTGANAQSATAPDPHRVRSRTPATVPLPVATASVPVQSVAVLPFTSDDGATDAFLPDALSLDLITSLSQYGNLRMIGSRSSFHFRDAPNARSAPGATYVLEGRVRHDGKQVQVTATLVAATDGAIAWSHHYAKPYADLFALQDAIARAVAKALGAKPETAAGAVVQSERPVSGNLAAWMAYLRGVHLAEPDTEAGLHQAIAAFREAVRRDRLYAAAYARLADAWTRLGARFQHGAEAERAFGRARAATKSALTFAPDSALAHRVRAYLMQVADLNFTRAATEYRHALQLAPNDAAARYGLGSSLATMGHIQQAVDLTRQALTTDPRHGAWYAGLATYLAALGQLDAARKAVDRAIDLQPDVAENFERQAFIEVLRGNMQAALAAAGREPAGVRRDFARALALQLGPDHDTADLALTTFIGDYKTIAAYRIAEIYALRRDPYDMFRWLDRARANGDADIANVLSDPIILRYRSDPRFALFCQHVGLPATTDAVAMK